MLPRISKAEVRVRLVIQSDTLKVSIGKDARHGSMEVMKYLRESCYHRIKCFVANSLVALMRK